MHRVDEISDAVRLRLLELVDQGAELIQLGDADDVAAQLVSRLPIANPWPEIVGPCYTSGSLQRELGVSRAALSKAVSDGRLLRLMTSDGQYVYPAFQVVDGALVRGLREVLAVLRLGAQDDPWTWAQWLNTPVPDRSAVVAEGAEPPRRRNIERLAEGDIEGIVRDAEIAAASWAA
ncbi:hypothetical protein [Streptomyces sp. L7]|uniref:hypothetical protein n=1 Tax=Streptomyces sp. L7 TaxID=3423954 RepID=UPI003D9701CC